MSQLGPRIRPTSEPTLRSRSTRKRSKSTVDREPSAGKEEKKGEPSKVRRQEADTHTMEVDDLTSGPAQEDDKAANQSIDDEELLEDPDNIGEVLQSSPVDSNVDSKGKEESDPDITDEEDMRADFNDIIAEISRKFEEKLAKRREERKKLARTQKKKSKE